ncbi:MAG: DNA polymerase II [Kiritimatiellae bacterium]|nr:DNA polymerase II [Kiritimatiellia bacterium]
MKPSPSIPGEVGGADPEESLVAVEHVPGASRDEVAVFSRAPDGRTVTRREPFHPFLWVEDTRLADGLEDAGSADALPGNGALRVCVEFPGWKALDRAVSELRRRTGRTPTDPQAPYFRINDPVQQYLMRSGKTQFKGMAASQLRVLALDIETATTPGFEFPNPEREDDRILAVGLMPWNGSPETLLLEDEDEAGLIRRTVERVRAYDPDVIVGHNVFGFDLPFLRERARRFKVSLGMGREGREPVWKPSRFTAGEFTQNFIRADIWGRTVADTFFLAQWFDLTHRALPGYGLKEIARHLGLAPANRTYLEPAEIQSAFRDDPARFASYLEDDLRETAALAGRLLPIYVAQAQLLPMTLQSVMVRGNAAKIDALLLREALRCHAAIPQPDQARPFEGGYTDLFHTGVARPVHHCDVRSLYPSIMLAEGIGPASDSTGVFLRTLGALRDFRLAAKDAMRAASDCERARWDALQGTFKILINSFYGYLGFAQARYSDFTAAERVTARGREILRSMLETIRELGGDPVELDTDGIYYTPPSGAADPGPDREAFRRDVARCLPPGIEVEFDGEYPAMFSYRMKNYALLEPDGEITIRGAALRSRGLEPFLRDFIRDWLDRLLRGGGDRLSELREEYARQIRGRQWPIQRLARQERLLDSPETYRAKIEASARSGARARARSAVYELALASGRAYRAGDMIAYYVTGSRKNVPVHTHARMVSEWNAEHRDENVEFYVAKLDDLARRLGEVHAPEADSAAPAQGELPFG